MTQGTANVTVGYDLAGRRSSLSLPNGLTTTYGYDAADQLTSLLWNVGATTMGDLTYGYDDLANRTSAGGSFAGTNPGWGMMSSSAVRKAERPKPNAQRAVTPDSVFSLLPLFDELRRDPHWGTARVSRMLVKSPEARVMLMAMPAGQAWTEHRAAGRVIVHVIAGRIAFGVGGVVRELGPGGLIAIEPNAAHDVRALEDSAFVLIVAGPLAAG